MEAHAAPSLTLPRPQGKLAATSLSFIAEGARSPLFHDVSFEAAPGEMIGITGASGVGKSVLLRLLAGIETPQAGEARLDGADVGRWAEADLGQHVGYVPQTLELLPGTIRDNIARFSEATDDAVIEAARRAGVHERILALPRGYDTPVGGLRDHLPGGLRQHIALARALFGDPVLILLDEPYTNMDAQGIEALVTAMSELKSRQRTIVLAAHRPSILARADRVLTLSEGGLRVVSRRRADLRVMPGGAAQRPEPTLEADAAEPAVLIGTS